MSLKHLGLLSLLWDPNSATPEQIRQILLHVLDSIKGHSVASLSLQVFEKVGQADKGLGTVTRSAGASVNFGVSLLRMIHRILQMCLELQGRIQDPKAREACVSFIGLWTRLRKTTGSEPSGLGSDEDSGVVAIPKKPEDAMVVQARCLRANSVLEVRHQDTGLLKGATAERAKGREGSMDTRSEVL